ncbi:helix-turn-helix domain-containing protein [Curtobacterium sp. L3-7]|uniref:IclR family transcriptional regulator n=1 Tax=Curtobacterium sp. L3-7 TaxID=3138787 RepID=UPI003B52B40F
MEQEPTGGPGMRTIDRALRLLGLVCDADGLTLTEVARRADLSASTALRLLRSLESHEFVRRDEDGLFTAGPHLVQLGAAALSNTALVVQARDAMRRVADGTTESCYLSVFGTGNTAVHLAIAEGTQSIRHVGWVGRAIPVEDTAVGRVLLGDVGPDGYVVVVEGAEKDVTAVSVPISAGSRVVAAMSCLVPSYRLTTTDDVARIGGWLVREAASVYEPPR